MNHGFFTRDSRYVKFDFKIFIFRFFLGFTHSYIIKYLIFCTKTVFCDKIKDTQFYRDQVLL
ncbi:hypothetical protein B1J94_19135 [Leptospira kirschneri serovar Grippotyphosa]|nr:hypothetical protein B1J94_19135 [Leptospira kirschneri serovar Grippotyphosa]